MEHGFRIQFHSDYGCFQPSIDLKGNSVGQSWQRRIYPRLGSCSFLTGFPRGNRVKNDYGSMARISSIEIFPSDGLLVWTYPKEVVQMGIEKLGVMVDPICALLRRTSCFAQRLSAPAWTIGRSSGDNPERNARPSTRTWNPLALLILQLSPARPSLPSYSHNEVTMVINMLCCIYWYILYRFIIYIHNTGHSMTPLPTLWSDIRINTKRDALKGSDQIF